MTKSVKEVGVTNANYHDGYVRLLAQIFNNAFLDWWHSPDLGTKLDALYWLAGEDAKLICKFLEIESHPLKPIITGKKYKKKRVI